jgi:hypothetical protein
VRYFRQRSLRLLQGGFMRNEELGYDARTTVSAGMGHFLVHSNRAIFALGGGLSTSREVPVDGDSTQELEALMVVRQSYFTYDTPKTNISTSFYLYPSLSQWGRARVELNSQLNREIVKDFTVGFTIYDSYDSNPPTEGARKNDVGLSLTIGWPFYKAEGLTSSVPASVRSAAPARSSSSRSRSSSSSCRTRSASRKPGGLRPYRPCQSASRTARTGSPPCAAGCALKAVELVDCAEPGS